MGLSGMTVNKHLVIFFGEMDGVSVLIVIGVLQHMMPQELVTPGAQIKG